MFPKASLTLRRWWTSSNHGVLTSLCFLALIALAATGCGQQSVVAPRIDPQAEVVSAVQPAAPLHGVRPARQAIHLEGRSESGALWVIDRPADWNGDLVVYVHGYSNPTDPIALPNNAEIRDSLLVRGFAVAASSFSENGYAVAEGLRESHELSGIFERSSGRPRRTFLVGKSLGGLIAMLMTQKFPEQYDGTLLVSGIVGGSDDEVQYMGDIRVLFDAVYGPVIEGDLYHPPVVTDINVQVVGPVMRAINAYPQGVGIIQALARRPLPGANAQEIGTSLVTMLGFSVQGGGDLFRRAHGHSYFDNTSWHYDSPALPPEVVADINARVARFTLEPAAAQFLAHWGEPRGPFRIPVLTMHTSRDPVVPAFHEDLLARVAAGQNLRQYLTPRYGHVQFSTAEIMARFVELATWAGPECDRRGRELAAAN